MSSYRIFTAIGTLAAVVAWGATAPTLLDMTRVGEISPIALLLLLVAVVSLAMGALRVHYSKSARAPFVLHIAFAVAAAVMMRVFPILPLALSLFVAVVALVWSFGAEQADPADARESQ